MRLRDLWKIGLLGLLLVPLLGSTCTKEKAIDFVVYGESISSFEARGENDFGSDEYDLAVDLDLEQISLDYGVDVQKIKRTTFQGLWYKITRPDPDPTRMIENGRLDIQFRQSPGQTGSPYPLVPLGTDFAGEAGAVTDWIDITELAHPGGVEQINDFLDRTLTALKNGTTADGTWVFYDWSGDSTPLGNTDFDWQVKVVLNVVVTVDADVPDF